MDHNQLPGGQPPWMFPQALFAPPPPPFPNLPMAMPALNWNPAAFGSINNYAPGLHSFVPFQVYGQNGGPPALAPEPMVVRIDSDDEEDDDDSDVDSEYAGPPFEEPISDDDEDDVEEQQEEEPNLLDGFHMRFGPVDEDSDIEVLENEDDAGPGEEEDEEEVVLDRFPLQWNFLGPPMRHLGDFVPPPALFNDDDDDGWEEIEFLDEQVAPGDRAALVEAKAAKDARIKALRDVDDHPDSLALRYSRACTICLNPNPARRAVLIACGHMMCAACAEEISKGDTGKLDCPHCRAHTGFVKTFEDLEETPVVRNDAPNARKRAIDTVDDDEPSSSKKLLHIIF